MSFHQFPPSLQTHMLHLRPSPNPQKLLFKELHQKRGCRKDPINECIFIKKILPWGYSNTLFALLHLASLITQPLPQTLLTFLSLSPETVSIYCSWIMNAARLAVQLARKMTAKKAQISTMILLVVPLGFSMGTELLKTRAQSSQTDLPIVKEGPPDSGRIKRKEIGEPHDFFARHAVFLYSQTLSSQSSSIRFMKK